MTLDNTEIRTRSRARTIGWIAGAIGGCAGVIAIAYKRRPRSRWDRARRRAGDEIGTAREQARPWMGVTALTAGTVLMAYLRRRKESPLERAASHAGKVAARVGA